MKTCSICKEVKDLEAFYVYKGKAGSYCRPCWSSYYRKYREANSEKAKEAGKTWRKANREKCRTSGKAWREAHPERVRYHHVKYNYGLSPEEYEAMPKECAICGTTEQLSVDHNHATGEVRGTLCNKHNRALGLFDDDPALLLRAVDYLMGVLTEKVRCAINEKLGGKMV